MTAITTSHWCWRPMAVTSGASNPTTDPHRLTRPQGVPAELDRFSRMRSQSAPFNRQGQISLARCFPRLNRRWQTAIVEAVCGLLVGPHRHATAQRCQVDQTDSLLFQPMTRRHQPDFRRGEMEAGQGLEPRSIERAPWEEQGYVMRIRWPWSSGHEHQFTQTVGGSFNYGPPPPRFWRSVSYNETIKRCACGKERTLPRGQQRGQRAGWHHRALTQQREQTGFGVRRHAGPRPVHARDSPASTPALRACADTAPATLVIGA